MLIIFCNNNFLIHIIIIKILEIKISIELFGLKMYSNYLDYWLRICPSTLMLSRLRKKNYKWIYLQQSERRIAYVHLQWSKKIHYYLDTTYNGPIQKDSLNQLHFLLNVK